MSLKAFWYPLFAIPSTHRNQSSIFPASSKHAARVFDPINQKTPKKLSLKGGLLRYSREDQLFYSSEEAGAILPGHNQSFFHKLEEINE